MNKRLDISRILILEAVIWFCLLCMVLFSIRMYHYKQHKAIKQYQIFLSDVDGLIVGSPVKYMGVQVGYVSYAKLLSNEVYVKFVLNDKNFVLPKGVVANVEFNGMGGTKSLELYPPTEQDLKTEKIINIKETFRLAHSVDLLDNMMSKMALIGGKFNYFMKQVMPFIEFEETEIYTEFNENLERVNKNISKRGKGVGK
ncbi:MAG: MlaD family protein [Fusobacterium sp.]|nr:MlaD family protein [Fusobacterium sp.]